MKKDIKREKFPGLDNITIQEAMVWAEVAKEEDKSPEQTLELISCIDDLLTIQQSAAIINNRRGNTQRRVKVGDVLINRIMQMEE